MGCAIGTGIIFSGLIKGASYSPDSSTDLFNFAALGFAFIETFAFMLFFVMTVIMNF